VTIKKRQLGADGLKLERRRSRRFPVAVPVEVSWTEPNGTLVKVDAVAQQVNGNGGYLKMANCPELGMRVTLTNFLCAQSSEARVLASPNTREGVANGVIIELVAPNEPFWGVNLQVEKTNAELQKLEKAMQNEGIDLRLLNEYRDSVDCLRSTASMVQQFRECHLRGFDDAELYSLLATQRVRRTVDSCFEVVADLDANRVKESPELDELRQALEQLLFRVKKLGSQQNNREKGQTQQLDLMEAGAPETKETHAHEPRERRRREREAVVVGAAGRKSR
jgi:hypothetical protein